MNGIEKLREYAQLVVKNGSCAPMIAFYADPRCGDASVRCDDCRSIYLLAVADQIKIEQAEAQAAYDWAEDNGGLDEVRHHLAFMTEQVANRVGVERKPDEPEHVTIGRILDAVDKRLMPEGMEWLRYEDGEKVLPSDNGIVGIEHSRTGNTVLVTTSYDEPRVVFVPGERVKRQKPAVLAADGLPVEVGQTVYGIYSGAKHTVKAVCSDGSLHSLCKFNDPYRVDYDDGDWDYARSITHTQPETQKRIDDDSALSSYDYLTEREMWDERQRLLHEDRKEWRARIRRAKWADLKERQRELDERKGGES